MSPAYNLFDIEAINEECANLACLLKNHYQAYCQVLINALNAVSQKADEKLFLYQKQEAELIDSIVNCEKALVSFNSHLKKPLPGSLELSALRDKALQLNLNLKEAVASRAKQIKQDLEKVQAGLRQVQSGYGFYEAESFYIDLET